MSETEARRNEWSLGWREVVVVLFVVFLGVVLLMPGMQQTVNVAREAQCKNNLKQLGLALHNYHEHHRTFPPGATKSGFPGDDSAYSWHTMLLPYVDQSELYKKLSPNNPHSLRQALEQDEVLEIAKTAVSRFECPKSRGAAEGNSDRPLSVNGQHVLVASANYVGSTGVTRTAGPGVFALHSRVRLRDIKDGSSNVFLLGERASGDVANSGRHGASVWIGVTGTVDRAGLPSDAESTLYGTTRVEMYTGKKLTGYQGHSPHLGFSSRHVWENKAPHFLMADGRVRSINPTIDSRVGSDPSDIDGWGVYQLLSSRSDGKTIPPRSY